MAPPIWILVLLVGAVCIQDQVPAPVWRQKPPAQKPLVRSSRENSIVTECDFEDDSKPLCDWFQMATDDGDWVRTTGPSSTGISGPPGGYPNGEGYYLRMDSRTFPRGGVARLRSPDLWEQGPFCVHFAYHMFGLSLGAQLKLLLLSGSPNKHPSVLWKHVNTQSPSWMPTAVTVPADLTLPSWLMFEGMRGNTAYLDISLDALSIRRGTCNRICMTQVCTFDTPDDLCGWSWVPTATGAKWTQKNGSSGQPGVGPDDDFSSPGSGFYMLLDPKNAKPGQKSFLLSPVSQSSGCLTLSFQYTLRGQSPGAALVVYASFLGSIRKHTVYSGQPGPNWQPVSVNYTGQGHIQFLVVGVFGKVPEPAVAVDAISIAPCGESFPQCDFEDSTHPFCDWTHASWDGGQWTWGSKSMPISITNLPRELSYGGEHYIYFDSDKFSKVGQSARLMSRPFCAPGAICVEFAYHMYGLGEGTMLQLLLGSPAGSSPISLWNRMGSQSPDWLNSSVTIPSGYQQPMQLFLEATRGTNTAFLIAVSFIMINHGTCRGKMRPKAPSKGALDLSGPFEPTLSSLPTMLSTRPSIPGTRPSETAIETPTVSTENPLISTQSPIVSTENITIPPEKPTVPTEETTVPAEQTTVPTEEPTVPTEETTGPTEETTVPTEETTVPTEETTVSTEETTGPTEETTVPTEEPTVPTEETTVPTEETSVPTEEPTVPTEETTVLTEKPTVPTEETSVPTEKPTVPTEETAVPTEKPTVPTEETAVPTEKPTVPTEETTVLTEKPTVPTEETSVPTEKPTVPTEETAVPTEKPTVPTEETAVLTEKPTVPTEETTVPTEKPTVPTEETTVPTEKPTVPTEETTVPTEKPTVLTEETTVPTEKPTVPTEETTVPTEKPTVPTEETTVPTDETAEPTEETTEPTEETAEPTEETTEPTEETAVPPKETTVPAQQPAACSTSCSSSTLSAAQPPVLGRPSHAPRTSTAKAAPTTMAAHRPTTVSCPSNAHHESCACRATCENPNPSCVPPCKPGCVCNPGFLFSGERCINASSCGCFYSKSYYKPGVEWFSPNCTEHCRCLPGSQLECQISQCGMHTVCQLKNGQYGCQPYGTATCLVYGNLHYVTFDEKHIDFSGRCTYILTQTCSNSTEPFFRITAKNQKLGPEGVSCLNKVSITLQEITITLLKGRRTQVGGQRVTLPIIPSEGIFLGPSGRFVQLSTAFGLRVRWDGDRQLFVTVSSAYSGKLCGFCGDYNGDSSNDNLKPDGSPAQDVEELGSSWQTAEEDDKECQKNEETTSACDPALESSMSGPKYCGQLVDSYGIFEDCLLHLKASSFFDNCMADMCNFQGLQQVLCTHLSAMTAACQDAGYAVRPWREPQFCPLVCPQNSQYSLCATPCPDTCHSGFVDKTCPDQCVEACECKPGFVLSGLKCVPRSQCGCLSPSGVYLQTKEQWYKPGCKERCVCEGNNRTTCQPWKCRAQEACAWKNGIYGCHAQDTATCTVSGDPHYLTFDGALHHFLGTCTYILSQPCLFRSHENYFVVSATNENRDGNLESSYVKAVHVQVFDLKISLIKGQNVMVNGHRVVLPVWPLKGHVAIRPSGSFVLLYTNFGLQIRYDGNHLVEVTVPSSYAGQLCGLCGNYNNNSLDDNLRPDRKPASSSLQLGIAWKVREASESGCFLVGGKTSSCQENNVDIWNKNCAILMNPLGPFSSCHQVVSPKASFASCVHAQCRTKGDVASLCRSLQAYAALCSRAGQLTDWRNSTFCPARCPPRSSYSPCANPCPPTCLTLITPRDCPATLPCAEGCECEKGYVLSGKSCVPLSQCGCVDQGGAYHPVGQSWYSEAGCLASCSCLVRNNITCSETSCKVNQVCRAQDGLLLCKTSGMGVCQLSEDSNYVSFDGTSHPFHSTCTYVLVKVCHPNINLPFFKISVKSEKRIHDRTSPFYLHEVYIEVFEFRITLKKSHRVLIDDKPVILPATTQIPGINITAKSTYTMVTFRNEMRLIFDGSRFLEIRVSETCSGKICGVCGNFNGEEEDERMMPSDELALDEQEFMDSWKDKDFEPSCQSTKGNKLIPVEQEFVNENCTLDDVVKTYNYCRDALKKPVWTPCTLQVHPKPFLRDCVDSFCMSRDRVQALCEALNAFADACKRKGLEPPLWRTSMFCSKECPAHTSYTSCLPFCLPSCSNLDGRCEGTSTKVPFVCVEGCICHPGYVLNEDKCIPRSQCGCKDDQGTFIPTGKTWISRGCTQSCVCTGGTSQCQNFYCPVGTHCRQNDDTTSSCAPDRLDKCTVFGDPYYRTFDKVQYRFLGQMSYILVKTVDKLPEGIERLLVKGRNKMSRRGSPLLHEVTTVVYDYKVQFLKGLEVLVNNQKVELPYTPDEHLRIIFRAQQLYLITDFEMVVTFDGIHSLVINLPSMYQGLVRGLCGFYDKNYNNDFMLPSGELTTSINVFGNSWEVKPENVLLRFPRALQEEEEEQEEKRFSFFSSECSPERLASIRSAQACSVLVDPQGPFAACHQIVSPELFQDHCVSDTCTAQDPEEEEELRCRVLSGYAIICQESGASLANWRNQTHCAMTCPANTVYQSCMAPCPTSCVKPVAPKDCEGPCVEGCANLPGYAYSGTQSLPWQTVAALAMVSTISFVTEDCSQHCTCISLGILTCEPFGCRAGEICTLGNFTRGCFRESPCLQNPCQNDGWCQEQGTSFICHCELGYGGELCTEPRIVKRHRKPAPVPRLRSQGEREGQPRPGDAPGFRRHWQPEPLVAAANDSPPSTPNILRLGTKNPPI
uniref:LOW QUALITY PROTEIN: zonadhesin n=1 Tax=Jaculus jaculus TaxID=51337 RepID=UPI001E1B58A9|nr:LOW QUALITY PROTEIN: zonadhesin [Jaculus jaculus]